MSRTVALVQARMESKRLPGKVLMPVVGRPVLHHIVDRLRSVPSIDEVVIATGDRASNDPIRAFADKAGIASFTGSESDVLDRFYQAAVSHGATTVVRITGDCPLVDPLLVAEVIELLRAGDPRPDLASVAAGAGAAIAEFDGARLPSGLDAEAVTFKALAEASNEATLPSDREHVTPYIWLRPKRFRLSRVTSRWGDLGHLRLTLDHPEDLELITRVYDALYSANKVFGTPEVVAYLEEHPDVAALNAHLVGREGYDVLWREAARRGHAEEPRS